MFRNRKNWPLWYWLAAILGCIIGALVITGLFILGVLLEIYRKLFVLFKDIRKKRN